MTKTSKLKHCSFCNKSSMQVKQLVAGPDRGAHTVYICNECVHIAHRATSGTLTDNHSQHHQLTPQTVYDHLHSCVIGQTEAKQCLSVAVCNHLKRLRADDVIDKSNVLLIGPSGSGKTLMVRTLADLLQVPFVQVDATVLTETGYVGEDVDVIAAMLLDEAQGNAALAQQGIVLIDEIDKRSRRGGEASTSKDVSGEGVQQALLKLIEGKAVKLKWAGQDVTVNTDQVLFIAAGAFVDLEQQRSATTIGFCAAAQPTEVDITPDDLIKYGLIPEFVGRFPVIAATQRLTECQLLEVLTEPKHSLTQQYRSLFALDGVQLDFDAQYLRSVAKRALARGTGARGLRSMMEKDLQQVQFELPDLQQQGVTSIVIDATGTPTYNHKVNT